MLATRDATRIAEALVPTAVMVSPSLTKNVTTAMRSTEMDATRIVFSQVRSCGSETLGLAGLAQWRCIPTIEFWFACPRMLTS